MAVRIKLNDSIEIIVEADTASVRKALNDALHKMELLAFTNHDGREIVVNPTQVLYLEPLVEESNSPNGASPAPAAARKRRQKTPAS